MSAKNKQVGGGHYKDMPIQPIDFIVKNGLPFIEGCIVKYISRWRSKGGVEDLRKVIHYAELLIEAEEEKDKLAEDTWGDEALDAKERLAVKLGHPRIGDSLTPATIDALKQAFGHNGDPDKPLDAQNRAPAADSLLPPVVVPEGRDWPKEAKNGTRVLVWRPRKPGDPGTHLYVWVEVGFMWDGELVRYDAQG